MLRLGLLPGQLGPLDRARIGPAIKLGVPVGMIHTSWGGTPAQAWTSLEGFGNDPELKGYVAAAKQKLEQQQMAAAREKMRKEREAEEAVVDFDSQANLMAELGVGSGMGGYSPSAFSPSELSGGASPSGSDYGF